MKRQHIILPAIVISLLLLQLTFAASPRYEITDLGTLGGYSSWAHAINDAGQVVGHLLTADHQVHAFLWDNPIGMIDLGTIGNLFGSIARGINNKEQVVGVLSITGGQPRAFIWDSATGMVELGAGGALSINNAGQIAGHFPTVYDPAAHFFWSHACIWDSANGMIDLGTLGSPCPNSTCPDYSRALGINDAVQVVGYSSTTSGEVHAFLWDSNTGMRDLGTLGGTRSWASAINNDGHIVGNSYSVDDKYSSMHAFLWDSSTGMRDLGTLGGNISEAHAINDHDQVVGHSYTIDNDYDSIRAFLWDSNNGMVKLDELLPADSAWTELRAHGINNGGQIVGDGINETLQRRAAFLMTPVPPAIYYVDDDANGVNDGFSWADAFNYLQDALAAAWPGDEIRVAQGVYKPDQGANQTPGDREATFQLINGVAIKGGYAGFGEPDPNARDIHAYQTILSGDLNGDDVEVANTADLLDEPTRSENSYHVVTGSGAGFGAVLDGCTITGGNAYGILIHFGGGGIRFFHGSITNCTIHGNSAEYTGGGLVCCDGPITNCTISGNSAGQEGGGLYGCGGRISNCRVSGNWAAVGGGMYCNLESPVLTNCTFSGNSALANGGIAIYCYECTLTLTNCILWGNSDRGGMDESAQIDTYHLPDTPVVNYSCIQGLTGVLGGIGNIGAEPLFVDANGADNVAGTQDDNLRLLPGSPCLDAGDNTVVPASVVFDLDGNPRFVDDLDTPDTGNGTPPIVDMGAYEGPERVFFFLSTRLVTVPEGGTATFTVALATEPLGAVEVSVARRSGDPDITVESGASLSFNSSNYWLPQTVTLAAAEDTDNLTSMALICISAPGFITAGVTATEEENQPYPNVLFVDTDALGANNGTSWLDAFTDLQEALSVAGTIRNVEQIQLWVAQGVYRSAGPFGDRKATFHLVNGVAIRGGYAGFGELYPDARDIDNYKTILSGDLNGNDAQIARPEDLLDHPSRGDNNYHVVTATRVYETAILDGFTVTGGNADGSHRTGWDGGGIYNPSAYIRSSRPTLNNCTITGNSAAFEGGGLYHCSGPITNCIISGNWSGDVAGGLGGCHGPITSCIISGNWAGDGAGGLGGCDGPITNCTIVGNSAGKHSGGLYYGHYSRGTIANCIVWGNSAGGRTDEFAQVVPPRYGKLFINYNCIQGWTGTLGGTGNIGNDPCFVTLGYWDANAVWVEGDYHLQPSSSCINAGDPNYIAEPNETDLEGKPRVVNYRIDMGAYESPIFAEARILPQTINLASKGKWITAFIQLPEDYNVADIDPNSIFLEDEIQAESLRVDKQQQVAIAKFNRSEVRGILNVGEVELTITGQLADGTAFEATDTIKVIDKADKK